MRVKTAHTLIIILLLSLGAAGAGIGSDKPAAADNSASEIKLNGGRTGNVPFPHRRHQESLEDCLVCHQLFPQRNGAIDDLKASGDLKKKQVMKTCQKCHRKLAKAGKKSGPVSCRKCHIK